MFNQLQQQHQLQHQETKEHSSSTTISFPIVIGDNQHYNNEMSTFLTVKVYYFLRNRHHNNNTEVRRFRVSNQNTFSHFVGQVFFDSVHETQEENENQSTMSLLKSRYQIQYLDSELDWVTCGSEMEWKAALGQYFSSLQQLMQQDQVSELDEKMRNIAGEGMIHTSRIKKNIIASEEFLQDSSSDSDSSDNNDNRYFSESIRPVLRVRVMHKPAQQEEGYETLVYPLFHAKSKKKSPSKKRNGTTKKTKKSTPKVEQPMSCSRQINQHKSIFDWHFGSLSNVDSVTLN